MNEKKIEQLVTLIQKGKSEAAWVELFTEMKMHKSKVTSIYYKELKKLMTVQDVIALYEDTLMATVTSYSAYGGTSFLTFFRSNLWAAKNKALRKNYQLIRKANWENCDSGDSPIASGTTTTVFETLEDGLSEKEFTEKEDSIWLTQLLTEFLKGDTEKRAEQVAILTVVMQNPTNTTTENKDQLLAVLPEGTSWGSARKKLQRAREDFKEFFEINK